MFPIGCAFVLGSILKSRIKIADEMSELYKLGNSVSQSGNKIADEIVVKQIRDWIRDGRLSP
jgi:hypothetical protein